MKNIVVGLLLATLAAPALGQNDWYRVFSIDGNHLTVTCKAALRELDSGNQMGTGTPQDAYNMGYCQGIVAGVASSINSKDGADLTESNLTLTQLIRVVQKYMDDHPEELSKPGVWLIRVALIKAFPKK